MNVKCEQCGNIQDYHPLGNKIHKNASTKCRACNGHIRIDKKLLSIIDPKVRSENFIKFKVDLSFCNFLFGAPLCDGGIMCLELEENYKVCLVLFKHLKEFSGDSIIYGFFRKHYFNKLHHMELRIFNNYDFGDERIIYNYFGSKDIIPVEQILLLFHKPGQACDFRQYLNDCKDLARDIIQNVINKLGQKVDIEGTLYNVSKEDLCLVYF